MTMAKLRLLVWTVATGVAAAVLLQGVTWSDDPSTGVMALVRVTAGVLAAYLCVATVLAIRLPRLAPRFVRRLVAAGLGTAMLAAPLTASAATRDQPAAEAPVLRRVPEPEPEPRSRYVRPAEVASSHTENEVEVTVVPGGHLWGIAETELTTRLGRVPTDAEIVPFWTELIELNRDRLVTDDPSFVLAGQVFRLPS
jgi:hypothetical protein